MPRSLITKHIIETVVSPTINKSEREKLRSELNAIFTDASNIDFNTPETRSSLQNLAKAFQAVFSQAGLTGINFDDMIKMPDAKAFAELGKIAATQFWDAWNSVASGGMHNVVQNQISQLEAEKNKLLALQKSLPKQLKRYEYLSDLGYAEQGDVRAFSLEDIDKMRGSGSVDSLASSFVDDYYRAADALDELEVGTEKYYQTLLKTYEAASNLYRMQATIDKHPELIQDKNTLLDYGYDTLHKTVQQTLLAREGGFADFINQETSVLEQIPTKLAEIDQMLGQIRQNNPGIINQEEAGAGLKTLQEIEAAYKRILNAHGKVGKQGTNIQNALNFDPTTSKQGLQALYDAYTKLPDDSPWEVQYQALLKYVRLYESYLNSENKTHRNKVTKDNNEFTKLYNQLKPMAANAENMLQNVLNRANKVSLVGMGEATEQSSNIELANAEQTADAERRAAEEAERKAKADKEAAEAEARAKAEAEAKAKADAVAVATAEQEKLAQEQAAIAAEKERAAKEAAARASKETGAASVGSILDNPMFANLFGKAANEAQDKQAANEGSAKAAQEELNAAKQTTTELEKQQKLLLYRRVEGQVDLSRISNRSTDALYNKKNQPTIQQALEYGFGGFGDGLYGSIFSAASDLIPEIAEGKTSFFEFDASKYNLFVNKTAEQAEALRTFLLSLQKFVGAGTLLDVSQLTDIADLSGDQLFEEAQRIFKNFSMTKQQFDAWLDSARKESEEIARLFAQGQVPANKHNFGTRFMQSLGYDGVLNATGDIEYDGNYHGSVIYDPDTANIAKSAQVFEDAKAFSAYLEAEAQAHQNNAAAINVENQAQEKLNATEKQNPPAQDDAGAHNANADAINKEAQAQEKLNGAETHEPAPIDDTPQIQSENGALDEQNRKLEENINLKNQANAQGVVTGSTGSTATSTQTLSNGAASTEVGELEAVRTKVLEVTNAVNAKNKAFYDEATIVGQAVGKENAALMHLKGNIEAITSAINTKNKAFYDEAQIVGQAVGKENAALISLQGNINNVNTSLGGALNSLGGVRMPNMSNATSQTNITNEAQALGVLHTRINEVTAAVRTKTDSFIREEMAVRQGVGNEIAALIQLRQNVDNVNTAISTLSQGLNNIAALNGVNLNVNSTVNLATIEATLANILTAIPNAGTNVQNNNAGGGGGTQGGGRAGNLAGRITVQASILDNFEAKLMDIGQLTPTVQNQINQLRAALNNVADAPGLTAWMNQFRTMRTDMNTAGIISDLDTLGQMATKLGNLRAKSAQAATSEERASYDALIQQMEAALQHMQQGVNVDPDWLDNRALEAYTRSMEKYNEQMIKARAKERQKDQQQTFNDAIKEAQREAGLSKSKSAESRAIDTLVQAGQIQGITPEQQANLDAYRGKIEALKNTIASFPKNGVATEAQKNQLIAQRLEVDAYTKEIQELIANYERLSGENAQVLGASSLGLGASADAYQQELTQTIMAQTKGMAQIKAYDAETRTLTYTLKTGKGEFTQYAASVRQADGALVSVRGTTTKAMGVFASIGKKIKEYSYYFTGSMMIYRVIAWVREGVTAVTEIDKALTELKKVTDATEESYDRFLNTAAKTAEKVGSTIKDVVSSTADWARLGYSMQEAHALATSTQILMNVSEFDDVSKATDTLISSIQAFKYTAEESMDVVDILNTIGNNYAISTADLATSLTKSSGSLVAANGTLEEAVALTATANTIIQDADVVGTALKTVAMRLRGTSTKELEEEGLDTDGTIESSSKLRSKIKGLSGVDILTDTGAYKSTYQILSEIAQVWGDINDMDQAALLELLAGKRAGSVMSAILQNPETLKDAFESANEATGSAMTENEKYLDSIQGRLDLFTNAVQTMWNDTLNSDFLKFIINAGTALIQLADGVDLLGMKFGNMWTTVALLVTVGLKMYTKLSWGEFFASIGASITGVNTKLTALAARFGIVTSSATAANAALQNLTVNQFRHAMATAGVDKAHRNAMMSQMGLTGATNNQIIAQGKLTSETLKEAVANGVLNSEQAALLASRFGLTLATKGLTSANAAHILTEAGVSREQKKRIITALGLTMETKTLTREEFINILAAQGVGDANERAAWATLFFGEATKKATFSLKAFGNGIKNFITKNSLLLTIAAAAAAIYVVIKLFDSWITTLEESEEKLTDLNSDLESTESKLTDLEGQLKEVQDRMKELNEQESLTFVEQEELDKLRAQNDELERQIGLTQQVKEAQQKQVNNQALKTAQQYENANFKSGKGQADYAETGATIGAVAGGIIGGILAVALAPVTGGMSILVGAGGALAGGLVGGGAGAGIGVGIAEASNQVGEAMDDILAQRKKLEEEYNKAQEAYAKNPTKKKVAKEYAEAEEALANYDSMMSEHLSKLDSYYSQIDLSVYDPVFDKQKIEELRKEMNDFYDTQDKWAIANGGKDAKANAITRIFGENASQELKNIKREIQDTVRSEDWDGNLNLSDYFNSADLEAFTARLHDMGIYVYEVENYFKDMAEAEKEAAEVSLYGVATDINKITEGLENLKSAFDEVLESSSVTAKTLTELNEVFGTLGDSWDNYVNIMFSGVSSTREMQEATEALARAFVESKILTGEAISEYERMTYIIQLRNMGVENAEEYVNDKIAENAYKAIQNSATYNEDELESNFDKLTKDEKKDLGIDGKDFDELSTDELEKIAEYYNMSKEINAETAQKIADEYGIEIENLNEVIDLLEEKERAEKKAADVKKAQNEYDAWVNGDGGYKQTLEDVNKFKDEYGLNDIDDLGRVSYAGGALYLEGEGGVIEKWLTGENPDVYKELYKQIQAAYSRYQELIKEGKEKDWLNADGTLKEGVDAEFAAAYEAAQKGVTDLENQIETELTAEIKLKLDLQDENKAIDDIQSVFDSLKNAQKEYAESGYLSVDTMQELLGLSPKYLNLLYDEHGQLNLNEEALYRVAEARITDMGIAQQNAIVEQALELATTGSRDALLEYTEATYGAVSATESLVESQLKLLKTTLANRTQDQTEQQTRTRRGKNGENITETVTVVTKVADLTEEDVEKIYGNVEKAVNAVNLVTQQTLAGVRKGGLSSGGGSDGDSALEALQKKYERQIKNLEGQQTYLENEVERLEALNKGASVSYYKEQIALENNKIALLEQERAELLKLEMNDEVADALWEVEHALQESTLAAIQFGKAMHDAQIEAIDAISEAYDAMETISSNRMQNLELYKDGLEINGDYASEGLYEEMIRLANEDVARNEQKLQDLLWAINEYRNMENPFEKGTDEYAGFEADRDKNIVELHAQAQETKNDIREGVNAVNQLREDMKDTFIEAWDSISEAFDNIGSFLQNQLDFIDAYEDRLSTLNINIPDEIYEEKIATQQNIISNLDKQIAEGYRLLNEYAAKYGTSDKRYTEKLLELSELESQRYQEETKILEFEQQIFDNQIDRFNQVVDRINDATQRLQNISDLIGDEDVATEDGEWTNEGLTQLGMAYQQMAYNKQTVEEIAKRMAEVDEAYQNGEISEKKYYETMKELSDQQWDAINSYEDAKDAIVDLNEARIDMIEEGLNKEIEAYSELIELKKEELDAERELYSFKEDVEDQTKNIASLQRRIASMSGSTDASTIAERTRLEQELREAQKSLDGTYRDHAYDSMSDALDDELDAYTSNVEDYIESLRESIKDIDLLIEQTYQKVLQNTDLVLQTIQSKADEYGFYINEELLAPWLSAQSESLDFEASARTHIDGIYRKVNEITSPLTANITKPWQDGKRDLLSFSETSQTELQNMLLDAQSKQKAMSDTLKQPWLDVQGAIQQTPTYADTAAKSMLEIAKQNAKDINAEYAKITIPSYVGHPTGNSTDDTGNDDIGTPYQPIASDNIKALQEVLNSVFSAGLKVDGLWGSKTASALKKAQERMDNFFTTKGFPNLIATNGKFDDKTRQGMLKYFDMMASIAKSNDHPEAATTYLNAKKKLPAFFPDNFYAKGTLGTKKNEWAIVDEFGPELIMHADPTTGRLQYLTKGSSVIPHAATQELMDIAAIGVDGLTMPKFDSGINMVTNAINKPEFKFEVAEFLHVDRVDQDTLPALEKMMDKKIDTFAKQLNASIRQYK